MCVSYACHVRHVMCVCRIFVMCVGSHVLCCVIYHPCCMLRLRECHEWYPELRVMLLHETGNHVCSNEQIMQKVITEGNIVITTYQTLLLYKHLILPHEWGYVVLDEGHKIRNPDAAITLVCKQLLTIHRIILTGGELFICRVERIIVSCNMISYHHVILFSSHPKSFA